MTTVDRAPPCFGLVEQPLFCFAPLFCGGGRGHRNSKRWHARCGKHKLCFRSISPIWCQYYYFFILDCLDPPLFYCIDLFFLWFLSETLNQLIFCFQSFFFSALIREPFDLNLCKKQSHCLCPVRVLLSWRKLLLRSQQQQQAIVSTCLIKIKLSPPDLINWGLVALWFGD